MNARGDASAGAVRRRRAKTTDEKIAPLEDMITLLPKHKGAVFESGTVGEACSLVHRDFADRSAPQILLPRNSSRSSFSTSALSPSCR